MKRLLCVIFSLMLCANLISCTPAEEQPKNEPVINDPYAINFTEYELEAIRNFGSPTEEEPQLSIQLFSPYNYLVADAYPMSPEKFASFDNIVKVRYMGKQVYPRSYEKRTEYKFEVIYWMKGRPLWEQKEISLYSAVFDWYRHEELDQTLAYFLEYSNYNCRYTIGEEYIVAFDSDIPEYYKWYESVYVPLNNPSGTRMHYELISKWDEYKEANVGEMNAEEFEAFLRGIIEKYNTPEEGSSDSNE